MGGSAPSPVGSVAGWARIASIIVQCSSLDVDVFGGTPGEFIGLVSDGSALIKKKITTIDMMNKALNTE